MKAVIVEDEILVADHLRKILEKQSVQVIKMVENTVDATQLILESPDIFLVDIRLADNSSGIDLGKKLCASRIPFIYITANNEMDIIKRAAITEPQSYITKPFNERDVIAAVELIRQKYYTSTSIEVPSPKGKISIAFEDISYLEADGSYTKIITPDKSFLTRKTLKEISAELGSQFIRIHRSFIVNKYKITSRKASSVFIGHKELKISRSFREKL
ncbi:MAG: response regulator transcription factor [Brumimicrobium sp.]|nr:response regulator transcription factor [Brumimicrobium sp.]